MRVFLDTNVLASALATRGLCEDVLRYVLAECELATGEVVLAELERVLGDRFRVPSAVVADALRLLRRGLVVPRPAALPDLEVRDPDDAWVLASALVAEADVLVTGDRDLLDVRGAALLITDPRGFWTLLRQGSQR